jgi:hypothetical protein
MTEEDKKVYGKLKKDLEKIGLKEAGKYVKLTEDFSEILKRIECTFEALSFRFALDAMISISEKFNIDEDNLRNLNWIFLSYSCTEFTNLFHGDTNGFPKLFEKLLNSSQNNKFPSYLGVSINLESIESLKADYLIIEKKYVKEILDIKAGRDRSFSHVDKNQQIDLPSTAVMIKVVNQLNNVFVSLYSSLGLIAIKNKVYTLKEKPSKFSNEAVFSKIEFFMQYLLRDHKNKDLITKEVIQNLKNNFPDFLF